jgi:P-type Ca2+ transporter type 2C
MWYTHGSFLGIDLSGDGNTLVIYNQLSKWGQCSSWEGFKADPFTAGDGVFSFNTNPCDYFTEGKVKATTISLFVLVAIEMYNSLNALSDDASLLTMPPWVNPCDYFTEGKAKATTISLSVLAPPSNGSVIQPAFLHPVCPILRTFGIMPLSFNEWLLVLVMALPVIIIDEALTLARQCTLRISVTPKKAKAE